MSKRVTFGKSAMDKMIKGMDIAAECVSGTIGPKGLNVYLQDAMENQIINDGTKIANRIQLEDKEEDLGAYIIRNVCGQQADDVGDGTTTVAVLTHAIIHEALKRPENPMVVKQSLKEAGDKVLKILAKQSVKLKKEDIEKVALISSEDKQIAKLITEIIDKLGEKAVVNVEDSKTFVTDYEIVDGYEAGVGFMSPHFITDKKGSRAVYENIPILVIEKKISGLVDISPLFEMFQKENISSCIIVCEDIDDTMLGIFVASNIGGVGTDGKFHQFKNIVIRATGWLLHDIEGATGAKAISPTNGVTPQNFKKEFLGNAKKVICTANTTLFTTDGKSAKQYANLLEMEAENDPNQFSAKKTKERAAKLRGGVAVLRIGASTDHERIYLREKADDAVKATKAAIEEGVVEGGGMCLWRIAQSISPKTIGEEILKKALQAPLRKILDNAGLDYAEIVLSMPPKMGYNVKDDVYQDFFENGVIDPSKVERIAVENAVSAASTFITSFATITDLPNDKK